jgi:hypothetical protein
MGRLQVQTEAITYTPTVLRPKNAGTSAVESGAFSASFANVHATAPASVQGVVLKAGETLNFNAGAIHNTLGRIEYDTTGSELLIIVLRK